MGSIVSGNRSTNDGSTSVNLQVLSTDRSKIDEIIKIHQMTSFRMNEKFILLVVQAAEIFIQF